MPKKFTFTLEMIKEDIAKVAAGTSASQIHRNYGISRTTYMKYVEAHGLKGEWQAAIIQGGHDLSGTRAGVGKPKGAKSLDEAAQASGPDKDEVNQQPKEKKEKESSPPAEKSTQTPSEDSETPSKTIKKVGDFFKANKTTIFFVVLLAGTAFVIWRVISTRAKRSGDNDDNSGQDLSTSASERERQLREKWSGVLKQ